MRAFSQTSVSDRTGFKLRFLELECYELRIGGVGRGIESVWREGEIESWGVRRYGLVTCAAAVSRQAS